MQIGHAHLQLLGHVPPANVQCLPTQRPFQRTALKQITKVFVRRSVLTPRAEAICRHHAELFVAAVLPSLCLCRHSWLAQR